MSNQTSESPANPSILAQMAVGTYSKVKFFQSANPGMPYPNLYVGLNRYQTVLPREQEIVVSDLLLQDIAQMREGYKYTIPDPQRLGETLVATKRRGDLDYQTTQMHISPQEANALRSDPAWKKRVYPERLDVEGRIALANLKAPKGNK